MPVVKVVKVVKLILTMNIDGSVLKSLTHLMSFPYQFPDPSKNLLHEKFLVINDDVCILAHFEAALSVIDMHDAGRGQA